MSVVTLLCLTLAQCIHAESSPGEMWDSSESRGFCQGAALCSLHHKGGHEQLGKAERVPPD